MELADRAAITDTVTRFGWCPDRRDWDGLKALFTDVVRTDWTALWGGEPQEAGVDDLLATDRQGSWRRTMDGLEATQHLITNILAAVTGDTANVVGVHRLPQPARLSTVDRWRHVRVPRRTRCGGLADPRDQAGHHVDRGQPAGAVLAAARAA